MCVFHSHVLTANISFTLRELKAEAFYFKIPVVFSCKKATLSASLGSPERLTAIALQSGCSD